jgi:hypothetical protein
MLMLSAISGWAQGPPTLVGRSVEGPAFRARLEAGAGDSTLAPWQREVMRELARTGNPRTFGAGIDDGAWHLMPPPAPRSAATAVYDPVRDRLIVFGGNDWDERRNDLWALNLSGTPTWTALPASGPLPPSREGHSAIYDPTRDRMIVYGGYGSESFADLWSLDLSGPPAWSPLFAAGSAPSARIGQTAIFDPARNRMLVFGGADDEVVFNEVWSLGLGETPTWSLLPVSGTAPSPRLHHSAIYDAIGDRMIVFGGLGDEGYPEETYALELADSATWSLLAPAGEGPAGRIFHVAVHDPARNEMFVFGGVEDGVLWSLSLSDSVEWRTVAPGGTAPLDRHAAAAVHDPARDRVLVFGGQAGDGLHNDVLVLEPGPPASWSTIDPAEVVPFERGYASAIHDPVRQRMIVFGGQGAALFGDVWSLALTGPPVWSPIVPGGATPPTRFGHSAIYDPVRDRMVVFGGVAGSPRNDTWVLDLSGAPAWSLLDPPGLRPAARALHSALYDPVRDRMVVFGGNDGSGYRNDVWSLGFAGTPAWTMAAPYGTPPSAREGAAAVFDASGDRMIVFGGNDGSVRNDAWSLPLSTPAAWTVLPATGSPPAPREGHSMILDPLRQRLVVFGGESGTSSFGDVWALGLGGEPAWNALVPQGSAPPSRFAHVAIHDPGSDRMVVFGGGNLNDTAVLDWSSLVAVDPAPLPRSSGFELALPWPNPARTSIRFELGVPRASRLSLEVHDVAGRLVRRLVDATYDPGRHVVLWDRLDDGGHPVAAGLYLVRLVAPDVRLTRRSIVLR